MTFSLAAVDRETKALGMIISSSSPAVASRCVNIRSGLGAGASQNVTDPRLGTQLLEGLESGLSPQESMDRVVASHGWRDYRQLTLLDASGRSAVYSGSESLGNHHAVADDGVVAAGNMLAGPETIEALIEGYRESAAAEFEERLIAGLEAALDAGGEEGPIYSAGLVVHREVEWPETTLRVDYSDDPLAELKRLWGIWGPQRDDYRIRALRPDTAPSFGAPGDP